MKRVVVTRAAEQASSLAERIAAAGMEPVVVPVIAMAPADDGGMALRDAVRDLGHRYDWVVLTSPNAARVFADAAGPVPAGLRVAAVGPGTAAAMADVGLVASLVPERSIAEGLLEAMSALRPGRVLLPQAGDARPVLADGLRSAGWEVTAVQAYRTVPVRPSDEAVAAAAEADAIVFTSSSTVQAWVQAMGSSAPPVVVSIGPATSLTARRLGLAVTAEADPHTLDGVIAALVAALTG